jgi:hypothetical protein
MEKGLGISARTSRSSAWAYNNQRAKNNGNGIGSISF